MLVFAGLVFASLPPLRLCVINRAIRSCSVGQSELENVKCYIHSQKEHHRRVTFQAEYREFLNDYGIKYDERYVWD